MPTASRAVTARRFCAERNASQLWRRFRASREAVTTATSLATKWPSVSNLCASLAEYHYLRAAREEWCSLHNTHLYDNGHFRTQQQQRGNGGRSDYTGGNGNRHRLGGGSNTGQAKTAVTANGTSSPIAIVPAPAAPVTVPSAPVTALPAPVTAPPAPVTTHLLRLLSKILLRRTTSPSRFHRASTICSS